MVESVKPAGPLADQQKAVQDRMRQDFQQLAQQEQADQAAAGAPAGDAATLDRETFVDQMQARLPQDQRLSQEQRLTQLYDRYAQKDGEAGLSEHEFDALMTQALTSGEPGLAPLMPGATAAERRALVFEGRDDLAAAATAEADRLFGDREALTSAEFAQEARIAGLGPTELAELYGRVAGQGPMSRDAFDRAYASALGGSDHREVLANPSDVNRTGDALNDARDVAALAALAPQVEARRDALAPEARDQFDQLRAATAGNPQAQVALARLLVDGRLPGGPANADGQHTLAALATLAGQAMQPPLEPAKVLGEVVQELENPAAINQGARGTCGVTTAQILIAQTDPAEYARIIGGLASPAGAVTLRNGDALMREPGTEQPQALWFQGPDGTWQERGLDGRADTSRLFAPAAMEYANGAAEYDNLRDRHTAPDGTTSAGTAAAGNARLEAGLTGQATEAIDAASEEGLGSALLRMVVDPFSPTPIAPDRQPLLDRIEATVAGGRLMQVALRWAENDPLAAQQVGHQVLVTRMDAAHVYYTNPWGQQERMARAEFEARVQSASAPG